MKKLTFLLLFTFLVTSVFSQTYDDPNYKLGNFKNSQIKAASVNVGGSWTIKKNSTTKDLELYYGLTQVATLGTTGDIFVVTPLMASGTATTDTAEFIGYDCTTDSLIISRNTASTSGLGVSYVRIK